MRPMLRILLAVFAGTFAVGPCLGASLALSVVQDPGSHADLSSLIPGESITFDVNLSGLDVAGGQTLGSLEGTVSFDGSLLGQPTSLAPGPIVPDPSAFLSAVNPGVADATYYSGFSASSALITTNGTFFIFTVVVQSGVAGPGSLSLDPASGGFVAAFDEGGSALGITPGANLSFSLSGSAVPEPSSLVLAALGVGVLLAQVVHRKPGRRWTTRKISDSQKFSGIILLDGEPNSRDLTEQRKPRW